MIGMQLICEDNACQEPFHVVSVDLHPITRRSLLGGFAAASALVVLHPFAARASGNQAHLRLMETTDIHVNLMPYDYYADKPNDTLGLARTASLINSIRAEAGNSMLIDNGDLLQGSPMGDYMAYKKGIKAGDLHPVMKAMNVLGYDCGTLGNHEFNYGLDFMFNTLAAANFPIVCANLTKGELASDPKNDVLYFKPFTIIEKKIKDGAGAESTIKVGFIGFLPPQIMMWDAGNLEGKAQTRDIVDAARAWVPVMKGRARTLSSPSPTPALMALAKPTKWKMPRFILQVSMASMRSSPATSIWCSLAPKHGTVSRAQTP